MSVTADNGTLIRIQGQSDLHSAVIGGYNLSSDSLEYRVRLPEGEVYRTLSREDPIVVETVKAQEDVRSMKAALSGLTKGSEEHRQLEQEMRARKVGVCLPHVFEELAAIRERILEDVTKAFDAYFQDREQRVSRHIIHSHPEVAEQDLPVVISGVLSKIDAIKTRVHSCVALVTEEVLKNHLMHGNVGEFDKAVTIEYGLLTPERFVIISEDEGQGFDPTQVADCLDDDGINRPSGRGIMLARHFLDSVEYTPEHNGRRVVSEIDFSRRLEKLIADTIEKLPRQA